MNRLTISLPEKMGAYIQNQVEHGSYGNVSEYIRTLIRQDQAQRQMAINELRSILDKADNSDMHQYSMDEIKSRAWKKRNQLQEE
ncbi:MAG TPA: type II toxin-antitoxin system ParD family antitoxin [Oceanospirillaceae bacterium]|nr:type II toxin-antitoxin system ParD family antitoxin [Oceanospirillaceae bacterium]